MNKTSKIEISSFGLIVIDGRQYTSDLMIYPDGQVKDSWWRKSGHSVTIDDIGELVDSEFCKRHRTYFIAQSGGHRGF